ncbi:hypothetical protein BHYA_0193g00060 [Botrytis hyacinthi]|uniref:Uncharacterized protein n=1 Tax=Botrytis hyacinthi TaxID=278943 RepID=A0A4Z1GGG7_9HELO|nr:hypothetical protein BHYA_0193g00060 [Botrytis hyacinthi]
MKKTKQAAIKATNLQCSDLRFLLGGLLASFLVDQLSMMSSLSGTSSRNSLRHKVNPGSKKPTIPPSPHPLAPSSCLLAQCPGNASAPPLHPSILSLLISPCAGAILTTFGSCGGKPPEAADVYLSVEFITYLPAPFGPLVQEYERARGSPKSRPRKLTGS